MADHTLGRTVHDAIFANEIRPQYLEHSKPRRVPRAIITGGQPGSGKSGLVAEAKRLLAPDGGVVLVDADELRSNHPDYRELLATDDTRAADLTHKDAAAWAEQLRAEAIAGRRNLIVDQTSRDPVASLAIAKALNAAGYQVELWCMAVSSETSSLRIHQRYERQKAETGCGRFSNAANHAAAFMGLPATVELLETSGEVSRVRVLQKDHRPIYENTKGAGGDWSRPPAAAEALAAERNRPMTSSERTEFLMDAFVVLDRMTERRAGAGAKKAILELMDGAKEDLPIAVPGEIYEGTIVHVGKAELLMMTEANRLIEHKRSMMEPASWVKVGARATIDYRHWQLAKISEGTDQTSDREVTREGR
jgi:UDP-N-acetylglucosamine kinase